MRLESTPERQRQHNDGVHAHLRLVGGVAIGLILASIGLEAGLYFRQPPQTAATLIGPDGQTVLGSAAIITPDYALSAVDAPVGSQISRRGSDNIPVQQVRAVTVSSATIHLLRLQRSYPKQVPAMRAIQSGEIADGVSASGKWEGTLAEGSANGVSEAQPEIAIGDLARLLAKSDGALLGISAPAAKGDVPISIRQLLNAFPELKQ